MREIIREDTLMLFCDQLNEYIAALGCSAQELCAAANISPAALSRYRSGSTLKLVTVSADGEKIGEADIGKEVLCISAAGKYLAALYSDSLTIYTSDLSEYATLSNTEYAKSVIMREDGTALLLGTSSAWLFIP